MNTRQLQYAVELSRHRNFSQVAARLGISQPALSKQILALEKELGTKLFERSTPLTLTAAGEYFIREAEKILYGSEQLLRSMEGFREGTRGKLSVGISPFRAQYLMPRIAPRLLAEYPDVELVLHEEPSDALRRGAIEGKYDLAIVNLPVDETALDVTPLSADTLVLAVPLRLIGSLPQAVQDAKQLSFADCKKLDFVLLSETQEMRLLLEKCCSHAGFHPKAKAEVVGLSTAWALCRAGVGATLLPRQFIEQSAPNSTVKLYSLSDAKRSRQPVIVTRRGAYLSEYAKCAIRLLTEDAEH